MKTRSATKAQRVEAAAADAQLEGTLGAQSPEILNLIAEALAADEDVLKPRHLGSLARSCKVIKEAVRDAKDRLKVEYDAARALVTKSTYTVEDLVEHRPRNLNWQNRDLTAADAPALTNVLKSKALAHIECLNLFNNYLGNAAAAAVAAAGAAGGLPELNWLNLNNDQIGDAGVQALASALAGGAFHKLEYLFLSNNTIGDAGAVALAAAVENGALPTLKSLLFFDNNIGDEGIKALMVAAGHGRLAKLEELGIKQNEYGEEGIGAIAEVIEKGDLPSLNRLDVNVEHNENPQLRAAIYKRYPRGFYRFILNGHHW